LYTVNAPPEKYGTEEEDRVRLGQWYEEVESISEGGVAETVNWLEQEHEERIRGLGGMPERTMDSVWWPFTQHGIVSKISCSPLHSHAYNQVNKKEDVMVVDSAYGDQFDAHYTMTREAESTESLLKPYFDGSASWFT
jgi:dethiobiotin synthetase/adenosylmethionine--8-amino-7-oxononanoate aminotransferase